MNGARTVADFVRAMCRRHQPTSQALTRDQQRVAQWVTMINRAERLS